MVTADLKSSVGAMAVAFAVASLTACASAPHIAMRPPEGTGGTMRPYQVHGVWYRPAYQPHYDAVGLATWYGDAYHNKTTADGEIFDMNRPSAAHTTLPLPSIIEVTNLDNGRRVKLRLNDRGPFVSGRLLDVSREAAKELGFYGKGMARVRVRYVGPAPALSSLETARLDR